MLSKFSRPSLFTLIFFIAATAHAQSTGNQLSGTGSSTDAASALLKAAQSGSTATPAKMETPAVTSAPAAANSVVVPPHVTPTKSNVKKIAKPLLVSNVNSPAQPARSAALSTSPNAYLDHGIKAFSMPLDNKLVVFPYDPNYTYPLYARAGLFTRIALSPGEKVTGFYLSDQVRWIQHVTKNRGGVYVMPNAEGLYNTATLETSLRTYELSFTSVPESENWYQRVSWHIPTSNFEESIDSAEDKQLQQMEVDVLPDAQAVRNKHGQTAQTGASPHESGGVIVENLNYDYTIEGDASFKPSIVFDDGHKTWIAMPAETVAPVFFVLSKEGDGEPVSVTPQGKFVVIPQLLPFGALLKNGKEEIRIKNKHADCGFFGKDCWNKSGARNIQN